MNAVFYSEIFGTAQLVAEDVVGVKSAQPAEFLDMRGKYEPACVVLQLIYMRSEGIYSICVVTIGQEVLSIKAQSRR